MIDDVPALAPREPNAFDPRHPGTPEACWLAALEHVPVLTLPQGPIVVVSPHPDDEVLGAGGLICSAAHMGRAVTVLSVTDGEAAYPDWIDLGAVRRRELVDALHILALGSTRHRSLAIPDGRVREQRAALLDALYQLFAPGTLIVCPYENDGHPDHDVTGEVCLEFARARHAEVWRYPIWSWHHHTPHRFAGKTWGRYSLDAATLELKARALRCFGSQLQPEGREPIVPRHVLPYFSRPYEAFLL